MSTPSHRLEKGSALVLVLVLLTVLSIALGAMFADAGANLTTSTVIAARQVQAYAADAGVESAIQQLRGDSSLCSAPSMSPTTMLSAGTYDRNATVTLNCRTTAGLATSVSAWALVTRDPGAGSLVSQSGGATDIIEGPAYARGGVSFQGPVEADSGLHQYSPPPCPGTLTRPPNFTGQWSCTAAMPPDPSPALPPFSYRDRGPGPAFMLPATGCSIFLPGKYLSINLGAHNYFASGLYYFEDTALTLGGDLTGGRAGPGEPSALPGAPCATDKEAGADNGTGVEFILGGSSRIDIGSSNLELYSRIPSTQPEGAAGVSIRTVPAGTSGYKPSAAGAEAFRMTSGTRARAAIHGMVYVPQGTVELFATSPAAGLLGGLDCLDLVIGPSASGSTGHIISAQSGAEARTVVITSIAYITGANLGVTSTAVVAIGNGPDRKVTVQSWVTSNP